MQTQCIRIKIKKDCVKEVREWFQELNNRSQETLATLKNEGVLIESVFLEQHDNAFYLIYYMKALDLDKAFEVFKKSTLEIDNFHKECRKKYCDSSEKLEMLLDLNRIIV